MSEEQLGNMTVEQHKISIVILTFNRRDRIENHMQVLAEIYYSPLEIIVVDNCSDEPLDDLVSRDARACLVRNATNMGAVGRNSGMAIASGDIVITLDDDVYGLTDEHLHALCQLMANPQVGAVVFRVEEEGTGRIINWCHPYDQVAHGGREFETNDLSEGAVAFRNRALRQVGLYPEYFFISHEGPDLAIRLINAGWRLLYSPAIVVIHLRDQRNRASWRRYYFDTRNKLWLVLRNFPVRIGLKHLLIGWGSMLVYAIRDGYLRYWLKGVWDAVLGSARAWRDRTPPDLQEWQRWKGLQKNKPGVWHMARLRIFRKKVEI